MASKRNLDLLARAGRERTRECLGGLVKMGHVTVGADFSRELDLPARHTETTSDPFNRGERNRVHEVK